MFSTEEIGWMQRAIQLAKMAAHKQEVPVGAVLVQDHQMIGEGFNCSISTHDPSAHAEIISLRKGAKKINNYRLVEATLYVTLEPCIMCVGAIVQARLRRVVYGASDPKTGAVASTLQLGTFRFNHHTDYVGGLLAEECSTLLKDFFIKRR